MLIHGFNGHYRDLQKRLFLGETFRVFANPQNTGQTEQEQVAEAPKQAAAEGADGETAFYRDMKGWVPERADYNDGEHMEIAEEWLELLGSANMVQLEITKLGDMKTRLKSPQYLQNKPGLKAKIMEAYRALVSSRDQLKKLKGMNVGQDIDWGNLENKMREDYNGSISELIRDIDHVIQKLIDKRIAAMRVVRETMLEDFDRRLTHLKNQWTNNPPPGYERAADDWIKAADQIMAQAGQLHGFDDRSIDFPNGSKAFEQARLMWEGIRNMETTIESYRIGQSHGLTPAKLEEELNNVEALRKTKITDEFIAKNTEKVDQAVARIDAVLAQLNGLEQSEELKKQVAEIQKLKEYLLKNRDLNAVINEVLNSTEQASEGKEYDGVRYSLPKGLRGQLDFIAKVPVGPTERNQMMHSFSASIKMLSAQINGAEQTMETLYPDILKRIALVEEELEAKKKKSGGYKIYWLAPGPSFGVISHAISDVFQKNYDRETKRKVGIWGSKAFKFLEALPTPIFEQELRPLKEIAGKMAIEQEHAENSDYQEWMKNHESASVAHLIHVMHSTTNQFEFRGVIELLAKKGRMRFDDEGFLKQLNRWQTSYPIPSSKYWHMANRSRSEDLIKQAVYNMYGDVDLFHNWRSSNSSAIESEKGKFSARFAEVSEVPGGLEAEIKPILEEYLKDMKDHSKHGLSDADPVKYEAVLLYAIKEGKMAAEDVLYYLIQGIGHGLLSLERGSVFTGLNNNYPAIELFASETKRGKKPVLEDVQEWAQMDREQYNDWFHSYVMYLPKVRQRLIKAQSQGIRLDHDYFTAFAGYLNTSTIKRLLQSNTEGYGLQETAVQNGTVGMLFALDTLAETYDDFTDDTGEKALSNMIETIMVFDGITSGRFAANQSNFYRMSSSTRDGAPRASGDYKKYYGRGGMSTGDHLTTMKKHMHLLDFDTSFPMMRMLLNSEFKDDKHAAQFAESMSKVHPGIFRDTPMPNSIDKLYESIGLYIDYAVKSGKPSVGIFIQAMKSEHQATMAAVRAAAVSSGTTEKVAGETFQDVHVRRHKRDHKAQLWRQAFDARMQKGQLVEEHHEDHEEHGEHNEESQNNNTHYAELDATKQAA